MKSISKILSLSVLIMAGILATVNAQPSSPGQDKERLAEFIKKDHERLQLSEDQKEPYTEITLKYADKLKALKKSEASRDSKRKEAGVLKSAKDEEMRQLLSKQQYEDYLQIQKERWEKMKQRRKR